LLVYDGDDDDADDDDDDGEEDYGESIVKFCTRRTFLERLDN
jgi:hypothetical protein